MAMGKFDTYQPSTPFPPDPNFAIPPVSTRTHSLVTEVLLTTQPVLSK